MSYVYVFVQKFTTCLFRSGLLLLKKTQRNANSATEAIILATQAGITLTLVKFANDNNPSIFADPVTPSYKPDTFGKISHYTICPYLAFWWASEVFNIESFDGFPIFILASAFPGGARPYRSELTLLDAQTNNLKLGFWGNKAIRRDDVMTGFINGDVNRAIYVCKSLINAMKYMQIPDIAAILATQATRIGIYMDGIEAELATFIRYIRPPCQVSPPLAGWATILVLRKRWTWLSALTKQPDHFFLLDPLARVRLWLERA
ncbi:hypothetical protein OIDMADRAFT_57313 [Oidiodendron maius Zn]|uniref:Uncharacterized protein n=1 Tax=Oidiodendron maius (strain Zn) TaxID=913774 RepID=A0A0C3D7B6_OIDMZ|nr:hypothetical protein OIDMADRAFT_57313 [Oidiodendron maius Zn]